MEHGFTTWKDIIVVLVNVLGVAAIIIAVQSYRLKQKSNYFQVVNNLVNKYQDNFLAQNYFDNETRKKFIDFVNEELFYIQYGYVPLPIAVEWIDGMLDVLPVINNGKQYFTNPNSLFNSKIEDDILKTYPRIKRALSITSINDPVDLTNSSNIALRREVVSEVIGNIFNSKKMKRRAKNEMDKIHF
ncbi:hypothetical protein [Halocola ammonii]